jgi:hypothetical protein
MWGRMGKGCLASTGGLSGSAAWVSSVVAGDEATSITFTPMPVGPYVVMRSTSEVLREWQELCR